MATPLPVDRQTFLNSVRRSGLVSPDELAAAVARAPGNTRGRVVARALVEMGLLTRFQAERLLVGRTEGFLLGQYRILDQVGRGGMGRVFKALHVPMQRVVALKVLAPNVMETDRARDLFLREVRAVAQLVHPNVVAAFDANEVDGRFFLVMEYIDGPNLDQLVRKQGPLSVGLACDYVRQAAAGLQSAHALGMVHRDVKPANLLVQRKGLASDAPGLVKVSDFGLARLAAPGPATNASAAGTILTKDNTVMGTPDYLSPEQSRCLHKTDIRSDVYSLGCTFYFLLTGKVPFPGGGALEKLIRHSTEAPAPVAESRKDVPAAVLAALDKMMAKDPRQRHQTPGEVAAALEPFAVSGPIPWAPPPPAPLPLADAAAPPADGDRSDGDLDALALINTVAPDGALTPIIGPKGLPGGRRGLLTRRQRRRRRLRNALLGALAMAVLGAAAGWLYLFFTGRL